MSNTVQSIIAWSKQKNTLGLSYQAPNKFEATANGTPTTIIATTLVSTYATNDDLVGMMVEVIRMDNGPTGEKGAPLRKRITGWATTTGTLTIEKLPWSTDSGDSFALLNPPHGWWSEDTGGETTKVQDADRAEIDDFWNGAAEKGGPYLTVVTATNVASTLNALISDFSTTSGAVYATLGATTAVGDLCEAWEWPEIFTGVPLTFNQPRMPRETFTGTLGHPHGTAALIEGNGTLEMAFRGPGRSRIGEPAEIDTPLGAVTDATAAPADFVADTGGTTTNIAVKSGTPVANRIYCAENGDAFVCTAYSAPNATATPAMRNALTENTDVYGLRKYGPSDDLNYALSVKQWHGKESFDQLWGCVPQFQAEVNRGEFLKFTLPMVVSDGYRVYLDSSGSALSRPINPKLATIVPRVAGDSRCVLDAVEWELRKFTLDLGLDIQPKTNLAAPNSTDGFELRNDNPNGTLEIYLGADGRQASEKWLYGATAELMIQVGKHPGEPGIFVFYSYEIEIDNVEIADDAGALYATITWHSTLDSTQTTIDRWMIGIG